MAQMTVTVQCIGVTSRRRTTNSDLGWDRKLVEPYSYIRWGMLAEGGTGVGSEEPVRAESRQYKHEVPEAVESEYTYT
jgi:hypothetical protein